MHGRAWETGQLQSLYCWKPGQLSCFPPQPHEHSFPMGGPVLGNQHWRTPATLPRAVPPWASSSHCPLASCVSPARAHIQVCEQHSHVCLQLRVAGRVWKTCFPSVKTQQNAQGPWDIHQDWRPGLPAPEQKLAKVPVLGFDPSLEPSGRGHGGRPRIEETAVTLDELSEHELGTGDLSSASPKTAFRRLGDLPSSHEHFLLLSSGVHSPSVLNACLLGFNKWTGRLPRHCLYTWFPACVLQ